MTLKEKAVMGKGKRTSLDGRFCRRHPHVLAEPERTMCRKCLDDLSSRAQKLISKRRCPSHPGQELGKTQRCEICNASRIRRNHERKAAGLCCNCPNKVSLLGETICDSCKDRSRARHYVREFGITEKEYLAMLGKQGGVCAICSGAEKNPGIRLAVDHDHSTGRVRALLCMKCNIILGHYERNREAFQGYLKKYGSEL